MNNLVKISEETIKEIIAKYYGIRTDNVCLYHDYKFTLKNEDKVREDFIYGIVEDIEAPPPAQPERKKGEWIYGEHDIAMCDGYWCDQCGFFVPWDYKHKFIDFIKDYHWCPSCGADMRGE